MPSRRVKASSARPSQPQVEGRADDASILTSNTVAQFAGVFGAQASRYAMFRRAPRLQYSADERVRIVIAGLHGEEATLR